MDVLVEMRREVGINLENFYLFVIIGNGFLGYLRLWECMRKVVISDELKFEKFEVVISIRFCKYMWLLYYKF